MRWIAEDGVFMSYATRGRNEPWRYLVGFVCAMALGLVLAVGLTGPTQAAAQAAFASTPWPEEVRESLAGFISGCASFAGLLASFAACIWVFHRKSMGDVIGRWDWSTFSLGAGIWLVAGLGSTLLDLALAPSGFSRSAGPATPVLAAVAVPLLLLQTFTEEFLFRGYLLQGALLANRRPVIAACTTGLTFGLLHVANGIPQAVAAGALGIATGLIAIRLGGLAFTFGLHFMNNLIGSLVLVSTDDVFKGLPAVFTQDTPRLAWFDVAVELAVLAVVTWLVLWRGLGRVTARTGDANHSPVA